MNVGPSVGASGAIFGVMAAVVAFFYKHQDRYFVQHKRIGVVLGVLAFYSIAQGFLDPYIDNFAHIGGFLTGGYVILFKRK